jgi:hypothetical protein
MLEPAAVASVLASAAALAAIYALREMILQKTNSPALVPVPIEDETPDES